MNPISFDRLKKVASFVPEPNVIRPVLSSRNGSGFNLGNWINAAATKMGWNIDSPRPAKQGGIEWRFRDGCPFQEGYRDANAAIYQSPTGEIGFKCFCGDHENKGWRDLRALVDGPYAAGNPDQAGSQCFRIADVPSIFSFDEKGIVWAVHSFIAVSAVTLLCGDSGVMKSTLMKAMGRAIADGSEFAGMPTTQREVIYLDKGENTLTVVQERFRRLGISDGNGFRYYGDWLGDVPAPGSAIPVEYAQATNPRPVVMIDALISNLEGDENNAVDVRAFMRQPRMLAGLGCAVVIPHHAGKSESSKKFRGSSDIKASVDVAYEIEAFGDPMRPNRLKLTAFKSRFAAQQVINLKVDGSRFSALEPTGPSKSVTEQLRDLLIANPGIKMADFCSLAVTQGLGRDRARAFLTEGKRSGAIALTLEANNAQHHTWSGADYGSRLTSALR